MHPGTGTIANYGSYISNCTLRQKKYRIPVNSLQDVQLYIDIGNSKPSTVLIELIKTCNGSVEEVYTLTAGSYVVAQDKNDRWYGVFKDLEGAESFTCFVIAITLDENIYFSEEYCIEPACNELTLLKGCYGKLDPLLSTDCEGVYFGVHAGTGDPMGDINVAYEHKLLIRDAEVSLSAIKNSFKQGRTRNFRTEKEKIYQFYAEMVPEWYISEIDSIFYRGEVYIGSTKYLLNETQFEKVEECLKIWKPTVTLKESCLQNFSCADEPCAPLPEECCDPEGVYATVEEEVIGSGGIAGDPPPPLEDEELEEMEISDFEKDIIVVECNVDSVPVVTGTLSPVDGLTSGSSVVTCSRFAGQRVLVERGNILLPSTDPGGGGAYYTKNIEEEFITFSTPLAPDEFIYIQTIPTTP